MITISLDIMVAGSTPLVEAATERLRAVCTARWLSAYQLTVVDVRLQPAGEPAEAVLVTPTIIRRQPLPEQRVVGDLSDPERVLAGLGLNTPSAAADPLHAQ